MVNVNYTREQFEALPYLNKIEAVSETTLIGRLGSVKIVNDTWVCDPNGTNEEIEISFMKSEFLNPVYKHTLCLEATLRPEQVRQYAKEHKVSFQEALEILGKDYVSKYHQYSGVYIEGHTTEVIYLSKGKESV